MAGWEVEGEVGLVTPVRIPSLTDGRCLLTGRSKVDARLLRSTDKGGYPNVVVAL